MKFTVVLLVIAVSLFASVQGYRQKRSVMGEPCPKNLDCETYAKEQAKNLGPCSSYGTDGQMIAYMQCGTANCGKNTKRVEDLSKPYPACCPDCEIIDPSKPADFGRSV